MYDIIIPHPDTTSVTFQIDVLQNRPVEHFRLAPDEFEVVLSDGDLEDGFRLRTVEDVVNHVVVYVVDHGVARRWSSAQEGGPLTQTIQTHQLGPLLGPSHNAQNSW